mgnify:FL=1
MINISHFIFLSMEIISYLKYQYLISLNKYKMKKNKISNKMHLYVPIGNKRISIDTMLMDDAGINKSVSLKILSPK